MSLVECYTNYDKCKWVLTSCDESESFSIVKRNRLCFHLTSSRSDIIIHNVEFAEFQTSLVVFTGHVCGVIYLWILRRFKLRLVYSNSASESVVVILSMNGSCPLDIVSVALYIIVLYCNTISLWCQRSWIRHCQLVSISWQKTYRSLYVCFLYADIYNVSHVVDQNGEWSSHLNDSADFVITARHTDDHIVWFDDRTTCRNSTNIVCLCVLRSCFFFFFLVCFHEL